MKLTKTNTAKLIAGLVGVALAISFVAPAAAGAQTASFNVNLKLGSRGVDVMNLQKVLNASADTMVASLGAGSPGQETTTFGGLTRAAVIKFQLKYGIVPAVGFVGPVTRAKLNTMGSVVTTPNNPGPVTNPTGGSLTVMAGVQPVNTLAPQSANRVPFTNITLTAGASDVTVNSITIQRTGLAQDAVFAGIVLLDANTGLQIGISKTLNSNHQAVLGVPFVIPAGQSKNLTIAGNMASSLSSYTGQLAGLSVVAINTTANVAGSLPITGAQQTVNSSLTIGSASINTSSFDPNNGPSALPIGTTNYRFSGLRVTAGSAEDVTLKSVMWNQTGSVGSSDLTNIVTVVNGTSYPTAVSSDGKYYTSVFPNGIVIAKGNSVDMYIQGDLVGSGSAGRTVEFDIYKNTDLYLVGNTYGYGITAPTGSGTVTTTANHATVINTSSNPWFEGSQATVSAGTVTTIAKANEVAAQNIAVNVSNQPLGGFATNFSGEPVSVQHLYFVVSTTSSVVAAQPKEAITSVSLVDQNGAVVAGPVDVALGSGTHGGTDISAGTGYNLIHFTDTVTFPVGRRYYTLKGKLPSDWVNGTTVNVFMKPSTDITNATGQTTGNSIDLSGQTGLITMNTMTVKGATLAVNISTQPAAQNIVAGAQNLVLANFQLDATQSGEDLRLSTFPVIITVGGNGAATDLTGCQLWNGSNALNTGSNVINTFTSGTKKTYSFDNALTVPKGTLLTLSLACNVSTGAGTTGTYKATADSTNADYTITGVTSGNSVTTTSGLTLGTSNGNTMSIASGSATIAVDSSSPSFALVAGGATGQTVAVIKLRASNEPVNVTKLGLILTKGSSTDVVNTYVYKGCPSACSLLGTATFTGTNTTATSTFTTAFALSRDVDTLLTVKADFANIGISQSGVQGKLVTIDPVNMEGTGVNSGSTITGQASAAAAGVRTYKSYPSLALDSSLSTSGVADGRLMRFKVTANSNGPIGLAQLAFKVSTTSATVTNINLYAYTDSSYSQPVSGQGTSGLIGSQVNTAVNNTAFYFQTATTTILQVPTGSTLYFELRASVSGVVSGSSVVTTLLGDSTDITSYTDSNQGYFVATATPLQNNFNFVWSGNATGTATKTDVDWSNGYSLPGLPASGLIMTRSN